MACCVCYLQCYTEPDVVTPSPGVHDTTTDVPVVGFTCMPLGCPDNDHVSVSEGKSASVAVAL